MLLSFKARFSMNLAGKNHLQQEGIINLEPENKTTRLWVTVHRCTGTSHVSNGDDTNHK